MWHILSFRKSEKFFVFLILSVEVATSVNSDATYSVTPGMDAGDSLLYYYLLSSGRFWMLPSLFGPTEKDEKKGQAPTKSCSFSVFLS